MIRGSGAYDSLTGAMANKPSSSRPHRQLPQQVPSQRLMGWAYPALTARCLYQCPSWNLVVGTESNRRKQWKQRAKFDAYTYHVSCPIGAPTHLSLMLQQVQHGHCITIILHNGQFPGIYPHVCCSCSYV